MENIKRIIYKLLIICMIIVTFFTYLTQSISYASTTNNNQNTKTETKENKEKAPEPGDLNTEKNPLIQPKDKVSVGRTERADQIKNTDTDLKEGSKYRGSSMDIVALTLNVIVVAVVGIFCLPILIGAVIISVIATINTNQKYIEAYEKGESARKKDTKNIIEEASIKVKDFAIKYFFTLDKLFFGDFKFLDINIFNINTSKESNSKGNEANANLKKGVAVWTNATRGFAVAISLLLFILGAVMLMLNSARTDSKATSIAALKNFLTDTVKGLMIALLITVVLAMILFAHDMVISIFNAIRYKMLENGAQSAEVIIYKNVLDLDINGYGYSVSFIAYLFMSAYHIKFLIIYINRLLTIGFLIVVSPIISVTYALDKIGDGKSQVLSNFFKEFVDAVIVGLIYPILYLVYIYALAPITASSPLLSLFVITQFSRAEKTIKGMLNLRKLTTIRSSNSSLDMRV